MNTTKGISREISKDSTRAFEDVKVNVKIKLSALWITLMLFYLYADILGFYTQGVIEKVMAGEIGGVQITDGLLFGMAVWMAVPSVMVFLSMSVKANVNRVLNIIAGLVSIFVLVVTFFIGDLSIRYAFQAVVEGALMVSIIWLAWTWPVKNA